MKSVVIGICVAVMAEAIGLKDGPWWAFTIALNIVLNLVRSKARNQGGRAAA